MDTAELAFTRGVPSAREQFLQEFAEIAHVHFKAYCVGVTSSCEVFLKEFIHSEIFSVSSRRWVILCSTLILIASFRN